MRKRLETWKRGSIMQSDRSARCKKRSSLGEEKTCLMALTVTQAKRDLSYISNRCKMKWA